MIFDYPQPQGQREHGPRATQPLNRIAPGCAIEFKFRCVYCLKRETWGQVTSEFELDHFEPQSLNPQLKLDYENLVYACRRCNAVKRNQAVADPFRLLRSPFIDTLPDGSLQGLNRDALRLIRQLDLNSPRLKSWRVMWMRIVALARDCDEGLYRQLVGFPTELPNLSLLRPPSNTRKAGLENCWFAHAPRNSTNRVLI